MLKVKIDPNNSYTAMQKYIYAQQANNWTLENRDPVVGAFDLHNKHEDYLLLFEGIDTSKMIALDFGCGPGRNIVRFNDRFKRIDGVDLDSKNLDNARLWAAKHNISNLVLYECNGVDLSVVISNSYDFVMSTICLQHICVHDIRKNYFKEFFRVLKPSGWLAFQMGFGICHKYSVGYYDNFYAAHTTNGGCDTRVDKVEYLQKDLREVGFNKFRHNIRPAGPGDRHSHWIYFQAQRP